MILKPSHELQMHVTALEASLADNILKVATCLTNRVTPLSMKIDFNPKPSLSADLKSVERMMLRIISRAQLS